MTNTPYAKLEKLLAYHEDKAHALRTTLELLKGERQRVAYTNGNLSKALALDAARITGKRGPYKKRPQKQAYAKHKLAQRQRSLALLQELDLKIPRPLSNPRAAAVLVRHGHIKTNGDGLYTLTPKGQEFVP